MHVALPPPQPPSCPQQMERRRSSPLWPLLWVPGVRCVLLCAHRSVCTRAGAAVQKCGVRQKCMYINVCKRFACVQLTMSTCTCVCVDNGVTVLVTFFAAVLSINYLSTCDKTQRPWIPLKARTADKGDCATIHPSKQCRDFQLSKRCFYCMRHLKLLLLWLPTVCEVFITLCPVMGVFGPATGASRS